MDKNFENTAYEHDPRAQPSNCLTFISYKMGTIVTSHMKELFYRIPIKQHKNINQYSGYNLL